VEGPDKFKQIMAADGHTLTGNDLEAWASQLVDRVEEHDNDLSRSLHDAAVASYQRAVAYITHEEQKAVPSDDFAGPPDLPDPQPAGRAQRRSPDRPCRRSQDGQARRGI
jgi:hypothetical protein